MAAKPSGGPQDASSGSGWSNNVSVRLVPPRTRIRRGPGRKSLRIAVCHGLRSKGRVRHASHPEVGEGQVFGLHVSTSIRWPDELTRIDRNGINPLYSRLEIPPFGPRTEAHKCKRVRDVNRWPKSGDDSAPGCVAKRIKQLLQRMMKPRKDRSRCKSRGSAEMSRRPKPCCLRGKCFSTTLWHPGKLEEPTTNYSTG